MFKVQGSRFKKDFFVFPAEAGNQELINTGCRSAPA
jgi:hypothetical protein